MLNEHTRLVRQDFSIAVSFGNSGKSVGDARLITSGMIRYTYVLARLQEWIYQAHTDEKELLYKLLNSSDKEAVKAYKKQSAELSKAEKRKAEVDRLFVKLYEDWSSGHITEYNFKMLSQKYQAEQQELVEKIDRLKTELASEKQTTVDAEKWSALIKQYSEPTELTAEMFNTLIEKLLFTRQPKIPTAPEPKK